MTALDDLVTRAQSVGEIDRVYKLGKVPASPVAPYVVLGLDSGTPSTYTLDASSDSLRLLAVQCFGTSIDAALDMARRADLAFRDVPLIGLPGEPRCTRLLGTMPVRDPDGGGVIYVLHTYQFHQED